MEAGRKEIGRDVDDRHHSLGEYSTVSHRNQRLHNNIEDASEGRTATSTKIRAPGRQARKSCQTDAYRIVVLSHSIYLHRYSRLHRP